MRFCLALFYSLTTSCPQQNHKNQRQRSVKEVILSPLAPPTTQSPIPFHSPISFSPPTTPSSHELPLTSSSAANTKQHRQRHPKPSNKASNPPRQVSCPRPASWTPSTASPHNRGPSYRRPGSGAGACWRRRCRCWRRCARRIWRVCSNRYCRRLARGRHSRFRT